MLANEQVLEGNICERCGTEVFKRDLEQWYFRITDYAEELLHDTEALDWPERVKTMQRNWIGRSEGARLRFALETGDALEVFTTRPDTVWGATFMVLAPEHPLVAKITTADRRADVDAYIDQARRQTEIERMSTDEARARDRRLHRRLRDQPGHRRAHPGLDRRLRPDGLRHRRHHGGALRRPARLRVRPRLRPADPRHRPTRGRAAARPGHDDRGLRRTGRTGQLRTDDWQARA